MAAANKANLEKMIETFGDDAPDLNIELGNELSLAAHGIDDNGWMTFKQGGGIDCSKQEWAPEIAIIFDLFPKFGMPDKFAYVFLCRPAVTCLPCLPYHLQQKIEWVWSKVKSAASWIGKKARYLKFKMNPRPNLHKGTNKRGVMKIEDAMKLLGRPNAQGIYVHRTGGATPLYFKKVTAKDWRWSPDRSCWMSVRTHKASCGKYEGQKPVGVNLNIMDALGAQSVRPGLRPCYTVFRTRFEGNWMEGDMYKYGANWWAKDLYFRERQGKWEWSPDKTTWMSVSTYTATGGAYAGKEPTVDNKQVIAQLAECSGADAPVKVRATGDDAGPPVVNAKEFAGKMNAQVDVLRKCKEFADSIQAELGISLSWKKVPPIALDMTFVADPSIAAHCLSDLTKAGVSWLQNKDRKNPMLTKCTTNNLGMCHLVTKTLGCQRSVEYAWFGRVPNGMKISLAKSLDPGKMCDKIPSAFYEFPSKQDKYLASGCDAFADIVDMDDDWEETKITHKLYKLADLTKRGGAVKATDLDPFVSAYCHEFLKCNSGGSHAWSNLNPNKIDAAAAGRARQYWTSKFTQTRGSRWFNLDGQLKKKSGSAMNAHINSKCSYA
eukprot:TRINITY_DN2670_c0_g1_i1.p2 TRINITY_DN2670_c0_g1~~TRINITY_DN2670_c0_g1_i1.p2  ORF type:complete len:605 (-),score=215.45 TRINITY_DN2670_c0_g1_i1:159-1973(-)